MLLRMSRKKSIHVFAKGMEIGTAQRTMLYKKREVLSNAIGIFPLFIRNAVEKRVKTAEMTGRNSVFEPSVERL